MRTAADMPLLFFMLVALPGASADTGACAASPSDLQSCGAQTPFDATSMLQSTAKMTNAASLREEGMKELEFERQRSKRRDDLHQFLAAHVLGSGDQKRVEALLAKLNAHLAKEVGTEDFEGNTNDPEVKTEAQEYDSLARSPSLGTVCETGFNAGHSALRFLAQSNATLYEFDIGEHSYGPSAERFLQDSFPGRLHVTWGDSTKTLPDFHQAHPAVKCDLVIVDGGHSHEVAMADLVNFNGMVAEGGMLVLDDTPCGASWCKGPTSAWAELKSLGCVTETRSVSISGHRGFTMGKYAKCQRWTAAV